MKRVTIGIAAALSIAGQAAAQSAEPADLLGVWDCEATVPGRSIAATYEFKLDGAFTNRSEFLIEGDQGMRAVTQGAGDWRLADGQLFYTTLEARILEFESVSKDPATREWFEDIVDRWTGREESYAIVSVEGDAMRLGVGEDPNRDYRCARKTES